jgi:hypothetical protein
MHEDRDEAHTATDYWASDHHSTYVKLGLSDVKTELVVLGDFPVGLAPVQATFEVFMSSSVIVTDVSVDDSLGVFLSHPTKKNYIFFLLRNLGLELLAT